MSRAGWMSKKGNVNKAFQRRFFVLEGLTLSYFKQEGDGTPAGTISLGAGWQVKTKDNVTISLVPSSPNERTYVLKAESAQSGQEWVEALRDAIDPQHTSSPLDEILDAPDSAGDVVASVDRVSQDNVNEQSVQEEQLEEPEEPEEPHLSTLPPAPAPAAASPEEAEPVQVEQEQVVQEPSDQIEQTVQLDQDRSQTQECEQEEDNAKEVIAMHHQLSSTTHEHLVVSEPRTGVESPIDSRWEMVSGPPSPTSSKSASPTTQVIGANDAMNTNPPPPLTPPPPFPAGSVVAVKPLPLAPSSQKPLPRIPEGEDTPLGTPVIVDYISTPQTLSPPNFGIADTSSPRSDRSEDPPVLQPCNRSVPPHSERQSSTYVQLHEEGAKTQTNSRQLQQLGVAVLLMILFLVVLMLGVLVALPILIIVVPLLILAICALKCFQRQV
eukprot:c3946_g1_i1.p1 GENE.c3946_g1_i1~~c3946_g1_i1.p1  ORF type:complete len:439 (+),score=74.66 c3946_g1_i1:45-1361(+)